MSSLTCMSASDYYLASQRQSSRLNLDSGLPDCSCYHSEANFLPCLHLTSQAHATIIALWTWLLWGGPVPKSSIVLIYYDHFSQPCGCLTWGTQSCCCLSPCLSSSDRYACWSSVGRLHHRPQSLTSWQSGPSAGTLSSSYGTAWIAFKQFSRLLVSYRIQSGLQRSRSYAPYQ